MKAFAWRFPLCLALVGWALARCGPWVVEALLPAVAAEIQWLDNTYRIVSLEVLPRAGEQVVQIVVTLARCVVLPDGAHCGDPRGRAQVSTLLGHVTLPMALAVSMVLAWPASRWQEAVWRGSVLGPALAILLSLDVPMVLWGSLWRLHVDAFAPGLWSPLLLWMDFLQGGGRIALAIVTAGLVVAAGRWLSGRPAGAQPAESRQRGAAPP